MEENEDPWLCGSGVIMTKLERKFHRVSDIYLAIHEVLRVELLRGPIEIAIIEQPTFERSERGMELRQKGFDKLVLAAGALISACVEHSIPFGMVTAKKWKTASKPTIKARVEEIFPKKVGRWAREDEWEAIGLSLWGIKNHGKYDLYGPGSDACGKNSSQRILC